MTNKNIADVKNQKKVMKILHLNHQWMNGGQDRNKIK